MKISVSSIIAGHMRSIKDASANRTPLEDYAVFFVLPIAIGLAAFYKDIKLDRDSFNVSITFFGIFIALLLNIQVAMFGIYQKKWEDPEDEILIGIHRNNVEVRRKLLEELNCNTSYLILVCGLAIVMSLISFVDKSANGWVSAIIILIYSHFLVTLLMVVKRAHALFQREYSSNE